MDIRSDYEPSETQIKAHKAPHRYKLFGGAMGGGKSRWLCEEAKELCMAYPGNRGIMCRYHLSDFKNSTLKTLLECVPPELIKSHNQAENTIKFINGSEIIYMGMSEETNIAKIKSMEIGFFCIDEASEVPRENFLLLQSRLRRKLHNGKFPQFFGLLATNPDDCWLKDYFVLGGGGDDAIFIPSLPRDNPHLPPDYENMLRKTYPEDWVKRVLEGSWDDLSGSDIVIKGDWVRAAINRVLPVEDRPLLSCDVARFGDDEIVIQYWKGNVLISQDITMDKAITETGGRLIAMRRKLNARKIVVDDAALGGGLTDMLRDAGEKVLAINGGSSPTDKEKFANLKTEMWWHAREQFEHGKVSIINDDILVRQLSAIKYVYRSNGKIMIEPKKEVKQRMSRSPDRADSSVMALWGLKFLKDPARDFARKGGMLGKFNPFKSKSTPYGWKRYLNTNEVIHA